MSRKAPRSVLIIEARFYEDIADELARGAIEELEGEQCEYERIAVPGALEIPLALSLALANGFVGRAGRHRGCIALGCVIRGETTHYEIVARESAAGLHQLAVEHAVPLGNGILTCDSREQAWARASVEGRNKGARRGASLPRADAARAAFLLGEPALMTGQARKSLRASPRANRARSRSAARLAAVQALYQMDMTGIDLTHVIAEFETHRLGKEIEGSQYCDAEAQFFRDIVEGVVREQRRIDPLDRPPSGRRLAAQSRRFDPARHPSRRRLRDADAQGRSFPRRHHRICRSRPRLLRGRGAEGRERHPRQARA